MRDSIVGNETRRGGYRTHRENYRNLPLLEFAPARYRKHSKPATEASVQAPTVAAALRGTQPTADPLSEAAIVETLVMANIARIITQCIAERGELPALAEVQFVQQLAKSQADMQIAEQKAAARVAEPAEAKAVRTPAGQTLQDCQPRAAQISLALGLTSASCCPYGWECPVFDSAVADTAAQTQANANPSSVVIPIDGSSATPTTRRATGRAPQPRGRGARRVHRAEGLRQDTLSAGRRGTDCQLPVEIARRHHRRNCLGHRRARYGRHAKGQSPRLPADGRSQTLSPSRRKPSERETSDGAQKEYGAQPDYVERMLRAEYQDFRLARAKELYADLFPVLAII